MDPWRIHLYGKEYLKGSWRLCKDVARTGLTCQKWLQATHSSDYKMPLWRANLANMTWLFCIKWFIRFDLWLFFWCFLVSVMHEYVFSYFSFVAVICDSGAKMWGFGMYKQYSQSSTLLPSFLKQVRSLIVWTFHVHTWCWDNVTFTSAAWHT